MQNIQERAEQILSEGGSVEDIVDILQTASDDYYNDGESSISDEQYDALEIVLRQLDPHNKFLTQIGSDVRGGKIPLPMPMGSLDQVYEGDTEKWIASNGWHAAYFNITEKLDGTSALLVYGRNGELQIAYSRGNGIMGADITRHIRRIKAVPQKLPEAATIRCEVILPRKRFDSLMAEEAAAGRRVYKNPRNYVAGRMNASESPQSFYDNVHVIATSLEGRDDLNGIEAYDALSKDYGFEVPRCINTVGRQINDENLSEVLESWRDNSAYEIDGLVISLIERDRAQDRKGSSLNPTWARKFKIGSEDNVAIVEVIKVHWEPSKVGYLKPRVQVTPVDLVGVTIQYASGFNAAFIRDNGIGPGAKVQITRSGDVIPYIQKVVSSVFPQLPDEEEFGDMDWNDTDVDLVLANPHDNEDVRLNIILETFRALEIPSLKEGSVQKLYEAGYDTVPAIIKMSEGVLREIIGENGSKIYAGLRDKLNPISLGKLAGASHQFGFGIGRRKMIKLVEALGSLDIVRTNNVTAIKRIAAVEGFSEKTAKQICANMEKFDSFLAQIDGYYTLEKPKEKVMGELSGKVFVFTGVRDATLQSKLEDEGATIGSSVSSKTTHLICKDPLSNSSKMVKARSMGIEILDLATAKKTYG